MLIRYTLHSLLDPYDMQTKLLDLDDSLSLDTASHIAQIRSYINRKHPAFSVGMIEPAHMRRGFAAN